MTILTSFAKWIKIVTQHLTMIIKETQIEQTDPKQAKLVQNEPIYLKLSQMCTIWVKLIQINPKWSQFSKYFFSDRLLSVLRSFGSFHPRHNGQWPPTLKWAKLIQNEPNPKWAKFTKKEWNWCHVDQIEQTFDLKQSSKTLVWFSGPIVNKGTGNCWYEKINTVHSSELYSRSNINKMQ